MATIADLVTQELSEDLKWREEELALMRKQLIAAPVDSLQEKVFLRANLAMIYAHYEGFCKFALESYISALEKLKIRRKDLKWPLAAYSLHKLQKQLSETSERSEFFAQILKDFDFYLEEVAEFERPPQIANLWPNLLTEWLQRLDLSSQYVKNHHNLLESLVNTRNQIAHGKKLTVSNRDQLDQYSHAATIAMHEVAIGISEALEKRTYRRYCAVSTILGHAIGR